jgi:hypothetical protein
MANTRKSNTGVTRTVSSPIRYKRPSTAARPPEGAVIQTIFVSFHLAAQGYSTSIEAVYVQPGSRPDGSRQHDAQRYSVVSYQPYHARPGLRRLLQDAARHVWAISTSQQAHTLDGEDPLPGL